MPLNFLFPPHTHTVLTHYMPLKSDEEGTDCGHIYKKTRLNSSKCFSFPGRFMMDCVTFLG